MNLAPVLAVLALGAPAPTPRGVRPLEEWEVRLQGLTNTPSGPTEVFLTLGVGPAGWAGVELAIPKNAEEHWSRRDVHKGTARLVLAATSTKPSIEIATSDAEWVADHPADGPAEVSAWWDGQLDQVSPFLEELSHSERELLFEIRDEGLALNPFVASFALSAGGRSQLRALLAKGESTSPVQPRRPGQDNSLSKAVFAEGRLWMRSDAGVVFSFAPGETRLREEKVPAPVLDLCVSEGSILAATWAPKRVTVLRRSKGKWGRASDFEEAGRFIGLHCQGDTVTLVGSRRVLLTKRATPARVVVLSPALVSAEVMTAYVEGNTLFVGFNKGEWGGGVVRVDLSTGKAATLPPQARNETDGFVLDASRHPVNGFASSPGRPGCVVAALGIIHFFPHGGLVEVCADEVTTVLSRPYEAPEGFAGSGTVAFFGIARNGDALIASGHDGLYTVSGETAERHDYPEFKDVGGIGVSFDIPGFALVLTSINQRRSMSGNVPMLVPMQ